MEKFAVQIALEGLGEQRQKWADARKEFDTKYEVTLLVLVYEGLRCYMTAQEMGKALGRSTTQMRDFMRSHGIKPSDSKTVLSDHATKVLTENAELMGVKPHEMDLTSPLAYLPMGSELRQKFLETEALQGVKELPEDGVELDFEAIANACISLRRGGALIKTDTDPVEIRLRSLGGDPERWGLSQGDLELLLQAKS